MRWICEEGYDPLIGCGITGAQTSRPVVTVYHEQKADSNRAFAIGKTKSSLFKTWPVMSTDMVLDYLDPIAIENVC